jgi:hypothetical protein
VTGRPPRRQRPFELLGIPTRIVGSGTAIQQRVDLQFTDHEISVAPFLLRVLDGVEEIHEDLIELFR